MKTHYPNLKNTPIHLTQEETTNPASVLDDFFQSYHLCDVRPILWQWLKEILSSPRASINDPHERNNDIFFYEKIESLVEAAWVMQRGHVPTANLEGNTNNNTVCIP